MIFNVLLTEKYHSSIHLDFERYPHAILVGSTGSGKSYLARLLLGKISKYEPDATLIICDYKGDDDFIQFVTSSNCFRYDQVTEGLDIFYQAFKRRQEGTDKSRTPKYLFFDEWTAYLTNSEKKKQESEKKKLATLLLLSRSFNLHIIVAVQRMDAKNFEQSRDNFVIKVALATLSAESKRMVFPDEESKSIIPKSRGKGYLLLDGKELTPVIVPKIRNKEKLDNAIWDLLEREDNSK
ncbi:hypothetical protein IGI37_000269 [Enterococcus sp. AZ194]|uniref:ATP-binding protein n=1 Tax=Enterococcus sp. AZ194 TaxID=2774629 RepID=UPI003F225AB0